MTASDWATHAREVLHGAGRHRGAARDELIDLLSHQDCALSALEIEDLLDRRVGRASVYRVLELLHEHDLVGRVELGDGVAAMSPSTRTEITIITCCATAAASSSRSTIRRWSARSTGSPTASGSRRPITR